MMEFKCELELRRFEAWSGGKETLDRLVELDRVEEVESMIKELFYDSIPTETQINDFLWFESDFIAESLGIDPEEL